MREKYAYCNAWESVNQAWLKVLHSKATEANCYEVELLDGTKEKVADVEVTNEDIKLVKKMVKWNLRKLVKHQGCLIDWKKRFMRLYYNSNIFDKKR